MKTQKNLSAKLIFTKQTVAKLNEETMALLRGGAAGTGAEGFYTLETGTFNCGSTGDITCQTKDVDAGLTQ